MKVRFEYLAGARSGTRVELDLALFRVGRAPGSELELDAEQDLDASVRHAELRVESGQLFVYDLGSSNGTFVNGHRVARSKVTSGDNLQFGPDGPTVRVTLVPPDRTPAPAGELAAMLAPLAALAPPTEATPVPPTPFPLAPSALLDSMATPGGLVTDVQPVPPAALNGNGHGAAAARPAVAAADQAAGDERVGPRTVARMIDKALAAHAAAPPAATGAAPPGTPEGEARAGPVTLKRAVGAAVARSTRLLKVVVGVLVLALLGAAGYALNVDRRREQQRQAERERLMGEISALARSLSEERAQTAEQLSRSARDRETEKQQQRIEIERLSAQLSQLQKGSAGETIAADNRQALYLLVTRLESKETPFCTGFAIRPHLLATNAHCIRAAETLVQRGATVHAVKNGGGQRMPVSRMSSHPAYRDRQLGSDVGILRVDGPLPTVVRLATVAELMQVRQGGVMYTLGFPGHLAHARQPEATLTQGVISRLMTFDKTPGRFQDARLIQHTAFISQGTSGSPIFDKAGAVIGVNSGGFTNRQPVGISGSSGQVVPVLITIASPGYNLAMRVDLVSDLLAMLGER